MVESKGIADLKDLGLAGIDSVKEITIELIAFHAMLLKCFEDLHNALSIKKTNGTEKKLN